MFDPPFNKVTPESNETIFLLRVRKPRRGLFERPTVMRAFINVFWLFLFEECILLSLARRSSDINNDVLFLIWKRQR